MGNTWDDENLLLAEIFKAGFPSCQVDQRLGGTASAAVGRENSCDIHTPFVFSPPVSDEGLLGKTRARYYGRERTSVFFRDFVLNSHVSFHVSP